MATKINRIQQLANPNGILLSSWLNRNGLNHRLQADYVKSGWLERLATGVYKFPFGKPSLFSVLSSYEQQSPLEYHIGASTALELKGFTHFIQMGKPSAFIFTPRGKKLPPWISSFDLDMNILEFSTSVFGEVGLERFETNGHSLRISSPERAIMECIHLSPSHFNLMDIYYLMEMLTTLRASLVTELLENCSSVKVKRVFLYMAEKAAHPWFKRLKLNNVELGSGTRSLSPGGVKNAKYDIIIPKDLAEYE